MKTSTRQEHEAGNLERTSQQSVQRELAPEEVRSKLQREAIRLATELKIAQLNADDFS